MHTRTVHHFSAIMDWNSTILNHSSSDAGNAAHAQDEHDADADAPIKYNLVVAIILGIILSVLDLTTILGNLLVCVTILSRRSLRNTTNYFILSLSSSDLLLGIIVLPFSTINTLLKVRTQLIHKKTFTIGLSLLLLTFLKPFTLWQSLYVHCSISWNSWNLCFAPSTLS